jgi:hypothetical protein
MLLARLRRRPGLATRLLASFLACALAVCGMAAVRIAMLGTNHVHLHAVDVPAAMAGWQDFRRAAHVGDNVGRHHPHARFERHRHAAGDPSVASLEAEGSAALSGDAGNTATASLIALLPGAALPAPDRRSVTSARWTEARAHGIERLEAGRLERPPRG